MYVCIYSTHNFFAFPTGILNGSAPVMIPGSDSISPQGNSPLGINNGVGCGNDNRENVITIL